MTKASSGYRLWCTLLCAKFWRVFSLCTAKDDWVRFVQGGWMSALKLGFSSIHVGYIRWHFNSGVKSSCSSPLLCGTCFMQLAENLMVYALLVPGRMVCLLSCVVLPSSLWCPYLGGITLLWVVWCLPNLLLGDKALVLIFWSPRIHYVICHWLDKKRWWGQSQTTFSRIFASRSWYLDGKLLQALLLEMAFRY